MADVHKFAKIRQARLKVANYVAGKIANEILVLLERDDTFAGQLKHPREEEG